jgi:SAM-dependent methyltransferase
MTTAVTRARWENAQAFELDYWRGMSFSELLRICAEKPLFLERLDGAQLSAMFDGKEVLEIGCGPLGLSVASFYADKARIRRLVKVEPLPRIRLDETAVNRVAWARPFVSWVEQLAAEGEYLQQPGERLDFDRSFDTVISYNVIDHVADPLGVLKSGHAALRPGGSILVGVDCLSVLGWLKFEQYMRRVHKDSFLVVAHPHSFLPGHVEALLRAAGFEGVECRGRAGLSRHILGNAYRPAFVARRPAT